MGMKLSATVAALASTLVLASGAAAITNGQPDGSAHSNVGAVYVTAPNFGGTFIVCSGTLVAPGVLLTAGVENIGNKIYREALNSTLGNQLYQPGTNFYFGVQLQY